MASPRRCLYQIDTTVLDSIESVTRLSGNRFQCCPDKEYQLVYRMIFIQRR